MTSLIPFHGTQIVADLIDGTPYIAIKPVCESLGISYPRQYRKLKESSWAVVALKATTGADGKNYRMAMIDRQTFMMWLATIQTSRIKDDEHSRER